MPLFDFGGRERNPSHLVNICCCCRVVGRLRSLAFGKPAVYCRRQQYLQHWMPFVAVAVAVSVGVAFVCRRWAIDGATRQRKLNKRLELKAIAEVGRQAESRKLYQ